MSTEQAPVLTTVYCVGMLHLPEKLFHAYTEYSYLLDEQQAAAWVAEHNTWEENLDQKRQPYLALLAKYPNAAHYATIAIRNAFGMERHPHCLPVMEGVVHDSYLRMLNEKASFEAEFVALGLEDKDLMELLKNKEKRTYAMVAVDVENLQPGKGFVLISTISEVLRAGGDTEHMYRLHREHEQAQQQAKRPDPIKHAKDEIRNQLYVLTQYANLDVTTPQLKQAMEAALDAIPGLNVRRKTIHRPDVDMTQQYTRFVHPFGEKHH